MAEATDVLGALAGLNAHLVLTDRGWTPQQWERFAIEAVGDTLLHRVE